MLAGSLDTCYTVSLVRVFGIWAYLDLALLAIIAPLTGLLVSLARSLGRFSRGRIYPLLLPGFF